MAALPKVMNNNAKFVEDFIELMKETLVSDGVSHKRVEALNKSGTSALNARFALGGDDSIYLQAGVTLIYVNNYERYELAPARLYSYDILEGTKRGLMASKMIEIAQRREESEDELRAIFHAFYEYALLFLPNDPESGLNENKEYVAAAKAIGKARENVGNDTSNQKASEIKKAYDKDAVRQLIKFFYEIVNEDGKTMMNRLLNRLIKDAKVVATSVDAARAAKAAAKAANAPPALQPAANVPPANATGWESHEHGLCMSDYAMFSGICDHVSPHETREWCSGVNAMVDYDAPEDIENSLKMSKHFANAESCKVIDAAASENAAVHMKVRKVPDLAFIEAEMALDGKHTLLDYEDSKRERPKTALRWEPIGEHGDDFASAAVLGHVIGRLKQVVGDDGSLSTPAKNLIMHTSAVLKIRQLNNMRAVQDSVRLGTAPTLLTGSTLPQAPTPFKFYPDRNDAVLVEDYLKVLVNRGLYFAFIPDDVVDLKEQFYQSLPSGKAEERLAGLRTEMMRDIAISTDRLWSFIRTLSGLIGESADTLITTTDEESARAAKQVEAQRKIIVERVAQFQSKIIETLISGLIKDSSLQLSTGVGTANTMVVVDGDTAKQIRDLASGESGRPFFEANVALRNLTESTKTQPRKLSDIISTFGAVSETIKASLERDLLPSAGVAGATLAELALPRNSYFVRLRDDTTAAIRAAFDRFVTESGLLGVRHIYLWELIEGADHMLTSRFSEFVGHILIQNRTSTGISAIYASRQQATVNAAQSRVSLSRLLNQASYYGSSVPTPNFSPDATVPDVGVLRAAYFARAARRDASKISWTAGTSFISNKRQMLDLSGWHGGIRY